MKQVLFFITFLSLNTLKAQERNPFYIGHSLVNFNMPAMVQGLALNAGKTSYYGSQIANGSPLHINYNSSAGAQGTPYTTAFPTGNYNTLIITEAVPLQPHLTWSDTNLYANNFYNFAKNNNGGNPIRFYIYETWHCNLSGIPQPGINAQYGCEWDNTANSTLLWHPRLLADFLLWSSIVTHVRNQNLIDSEIWLIPAGRAFYNLTTQINAGNVAGITNVNQLFTDTIHLTNAGNYFVACVMYATIYRQSPVGLTTNLNNMWNVPFTDMPTTAQAQVMQQVAWNTVTSLTSWTGVSGVLANDNFEKTNFSIYPNPANDKIFIQNNDDSSVENIIVFDISGKKILEQNNNFTSINIQNLETGIYFLQIKSDNKTSQIKFIKN